MEFVTNLLNITDKFLTIGSNFYSTTSEIAMKMYKMDTMFKMNELRIDALMESADAQMEQAVLQAKEYELERKASQVQSMQNYAERLSQYNEAAEFNSFVTESRLGGGESMSVRKFVERQAKIVAQDVDRINSQAIAIDTALSRQGHMSMLRGINAAKATRNQALQTAYQGTIDMLEVTPNPFDSAKDIVSGVRTIASSISEALEIK